MVRPFGCEHFALFVARSGEGDLVLEVSVGFKDVMHRQRAAILLNEPRCPFIGDQQMCRGTGFKSRPRHASAHHCHPGKARQRQPALGLQQATGLLRLDEQTVRRLKIDDLLDVVQLARRFIGEYGRHNFLP